MHSFPLRAAFAALVLLATSVSAFAWGPNAQRAIAGTAFQIVGESYMDPFKNVEVNYEPDVIRGALNYRQILGIDPMLVSDSEMVNAVGTEIQLLRTLRKNGVGSFFAYRMGALAGLVGDVMLPFSFDHDPASRRLLAQIESDIEAHLKTYTMKSRPERLEYIRNPAEYFRERRTFHDDTKTLIEADYKVGAGYSGYLLKGGPALFEGAVKAAADAWFTVLRSEGDQSDVRPSTKSVTWYLVDEIEFLLQQKRNMLEAERAYKQFATQNSRDLAAYERIADAFYNFGDKAGRDRGVQEWTLALAYNGPQRQSILEKLAVHYLAEGQKYIDQSTKPGAPAESLQLALNNFTKALEYDRENSSAANLINQTQVAIAEREERMRVAIEQVAAGESVLKEAEGSMVAERYEDAIAKYNLAIRVLEQVTDEFTEQKAAASASISAAKLNITRIINKVLDVAQAYIDEGDRSVDDKKFDDGMNQYQGVEVVLKVVPDDPGPQFEQKTKLIEEARNKVQEAEQKKRAHEAAQAEAAKAPKPAAPK